LLGELLLLLLKIRSDLTLRNEARVDIHRRKLIVIVVPIELRLYAVPPERKQVLLELFILLIFPILIYVLLIKIVCGRWHKWGLNLLLPEIFPREVLKPRVSFDFCGPILP
jgi:hypothetical protein